jgi:hypothetical protein
VIDGFPDYLVKVPGLSIQKLRLFPVQKVQMELSDSRYRDQVSLILNETQPVSTFHKVTKSVAKRVGRLPTHPVVLLEGSPLVTHFHNLVSIFNQATD